MSEIAPEAQDHLDALEMAQEDAQAVRGPIEVRTAGVVTGVSFPERVIDLIVVPYGQEATITERGRTFREVVAPGAFDGIERRANRVRVNYQHQDTELSHLLGRVTRFFPSRTEGLVARVRIRRGPVGDDALAAADDGDLFASAGFGIMPGGESWPERSLRRLTRLFLDHVAMTPDPAYTGARVLAVRQATEPPAASPEPPASATPNLDLVRSWTLERRFTRCV